MAYKISSDCVACDSCRPPCPSGAIDVADGKYWINPALCDNCETLPEPQCVISCPLSLPTPATAKRGRSKKTARELTSSTLFANGKNHPFASAILVWEACNLLAQRQTFPWQTDASNQPRYHRSLHRTGDLSLWIQEAQGSDANPHVSNQITTDIASFDIRSACMHLIYAAYATNLDRPWEQDFVLNDQQIEQYLGLDKRKDLTKPAKLTFIKEIAQQACSVFAMMRYPAKGRIPEFMATPAPLWYLQELKHHFQEDEDGCKHLVGLTLRIRAGIWAKHFLNVQGCKERTAFYQYGTLPKSLLTTIMSIWQQHEGAARMMVWLLFKARLGKEQRVLVPTLMRIAYGEQKLNQAMLNSDDRKRLLRAFEGDLEALHYYGLKPVFDPETYPLDIQPFWAKAAEVPDDAEEALEFWMTEGSNLTDASPRGKWQALMNARILQFVLPEDWSAPNRTDKSPATKSKSRHSRTAAKPAADRSASRSVSSGSAALKRRSSQTVYQGDRSPTEPVACTLSPQQIIATRKQRGISQRQLAKLIGKSQSWVRDVENGRFCPKPEDEQAIRAALEV